MTDDEIKDLIRKHVTTHARDVNCLDNSKVLEKEMADDYENIGRHLKLTTAQAIALSLRVEKLVTSANIAVSVTWDGDKP